MLLATYVFTLWANIKTPLWGDDYCRIIPPSLTEPFALAWRDYFHWTGRFFATAATYLALEIGRYWSPLLFDVVNGAIFIGLILNVLALAQLAAGLTRTPRLTDVGAIDVAFVTLLLWWLPRDFAEVALWKTGSIGYLWAVTGELWVLRLALADSPEERPWVLLSAFILATILETLSLFITGFLLVWCVLCWQREGKAPWQLATAHALGTIFVLAAPGNFVRAATMPPSPPLDRLIGVIGNLGSLFDPYWIVAALVVAFAYWSSARSVRRAESLWIVLAAGGGWLFAPAALMYIGIVLGVPRAALAARVSLPASVFFVCYLTALFLRRPVSVVRERCLGLILAALLILHCAVVIPHLDRLAQISEEWVNNPQLKMGPRADTMLPLVRVGGKIVYARKDVFFEGLTMNKDYFLNSCFAHAFGVKSVVARP